MQPIRILEWRTMLKKVEERQEKNKGIVWRSGRVTLFFPQRLGQTKRLLFFIWDCSNIPFSIHQRCTTRVATYNTRVLFYFFASFLRLFYVSSTTFRSGMIQVCTRRNGIWGRPMTNRMSVTFWQVGKWRQTSCYRVVVANRLDINSSI